MDVERLEFSRVGRFGISDWAVESQNLDVEAG